METALGVHKMPLPAKPGYLQLTSVKIGKVFENSKCLYLKLHPCRGVGRKPEWKWRLSRATKKHRDTVRPDSGRPTQYKTRSESLALLVELN